MFDRYAVYYTPPPGPLADFGARWLGWDLTIGKECRHPTAGDFDVACLTKRPRNYGFHGTIKAPFPLAETMCPLSLSKSFSQFCAGRPQFEIAGLRLARLDGFLALIPDGNQSHLADLAAAAVAAFDDFRAPISETQLARRRAQGLSDAEDANLIAWGYPYVFDCFRFHMTLTGALPTEQLTKVEAALLPLIEPLLTRPFKIEALTLCGQDRLGRFHQIDRRALSG